MSSAAYNSQYNRSVAGVNNDFAAKRAANTFSRSLSQRRGSRNLGDYQSDFRRSMPSFQSSFANRGLADSGVYKRALQQRTGDYAQNLGRMQEDQMSDMFQYDLNDRQFVSERDRVLEELQLQKANQIALTALNINALKPYMA